MAIVREEKVVRNNASDMYEINDTQTMIAFEPNSDTIWFNGKPFDYDTLNPVFARENTALQTHNLQRYHALTQNQILSPYPVAYTALDQGMAETSFRTYHYQAFNSKRFNLDKGSQSGNIISFTSAQGVKHHLIWYPVLGSGSVRNVYSQYVIQTCRYILIEGDNWQSPAAITTGSFTGTVTGALTYQNLVAQIWPIAVDPVNKFIYCAEVVLQSSTAYNAAYYTQAFTKSNAICKCPFTTRQDVGGTLAISSASGSVIGNIFTYSQHDFDPNPIFYCGLNNDNSPMFLTQVENETVGTVGSSGANSANYLTSYAASKTQWTGVRTNTSPRVYWDKLNSGTQTNVASQNVSANNWGGSGASKLMYRFAPSKFESSTAAGETDIKYAYNLCYNATGNVPGLSYYKWNRATPASSTSGLMTIDWAGQTTTDMIAHPFAVAEGNGTRTLYPELSCAHVFLTKHGSRYFINVLHTHGYSGNMILRPANSKRLTTFEVDMSTWTACTWVASISVPAYSFMTLDDNATKIAVIRDGGVDVYSSNNGVWSITATEPGAITCLGRDQSNRLWALDQIVTSFDQLTANNDYNAGVSLTELKPKIRLVSESLPNRVNIVLNDRNLTYSGSNISTSAIVNAYNTTDFRIVTTVYLKLSGVNAVFTANGSTELSITTSSSADTTVPITVTGSGYIQIAGSFAL